MTHKVEKERRKSEVFNNLQTGQLVLNEKTHTHTHTHTCYTCVRFFLNRCKGSKERDMSLLTLYTKGFMICTHRIHPLTKVSFFSISAPLLNPQLMLKAATQSSIS